MDTVTCEQLRSQRFKGTVKRIEDIAYTNEIELDAVYHNRQEYLLHVLVLKIAELEERIDQLERKKQS